MKRKLLMLLSLLMVFSMVSIHIFADDTNYADTLVAIDITNATGSAGDTVTIGITLNTGDATITTVGIKDPVCENATFSEMRISSDYEKKCVLTKVDEKGLTSAITNPITINEKICDIDFVIDSDAVPGTYDISCTYVIKTKGNVCYKTTVSNGSITVVDNRPEITDLSISDKSVTYNGTAQNIEVAGTQEGDKVTYTYKLGEADVAGNNAISVGEYTVTATVERDGYKPWTDSATLMITPKEVTISGITAEDKVYDGTTDVNVDANDVTFEGKIEGDDLGATFPTVKLSSANVGSYTLDFSGTALSGDSAKNYTLKEIKEVTVNVTKRAITVWPANNSKKVDTADPKLSATSTGALAAGHTITFDVTREAGEEVGDYVITAVATIKDAKDNDVTKNYDITPKTGTFSIVDKTLKEIKITTEPTKKEYVEDEKLDLTGMVVTAYYDNDTNVEVYNSTTNLLTAPTEYTFTANDATAGTKTITVAFGGKTNSFDVTVSAKELQSITLDTTNVQKSFKVGTTFNYNNLKVIPVYNNNVTYDALTSGYTVSEPNMNTLGKQDITVTYTYNGVEKTETYEITIVDKELDSLSYSGKVKTVYVEGTKFDTTNLVVTAHYDNNTSAPVTGWTYAPDGELTTADKKITITYTEGTITKTCDIDITVNEAQVKDFEVKSWEKDYIEGQSFDTSKVVLNVTYDNDKTAEVTTGFTVSPATLQLGTKKVTITYAGISKDVNVTVAEKKLQRIEVSTSKTAYVDGETLDLTKITVNAYYDNFPKTPVTISTTEISTDVNTVLLEEAENGKITVKVTFDGEEGELIITVDPCVATITTTVGGITNVTHFASLTDAINAAEAGDTIEIVGDDEIDEDVIITDDITIVVTEDGSLTQKDGTNITVSNGSMNIKNNSGDKVKMTINGEEVTIENGEETTVEPVVEEEDNFDAYYAFYLQMLQWRNRTFLVSYKQTEGGTISGANSARFSQPVTFSVTPNEGYEIADVTVNGKSVGAVETYTIKNIKANTTVSASFNKIETETVEVEIVPEITVWVNPFTDVAETDAFYAAVQYVYENGLFKGMSDTEFAPATTMNRAMFVTVLGRLTGVNVDDYTTVTFSDCEAGSWYAPYVEWAAKAGIVKGMSATEFAPDAEITVEQAVTILYRYMTTMGYDLSGAVDLANYADGADVADWATEAMQWAVANNIYVADTLAPQTAAARSLVATMLYNLSNLLVK